MNKTLIVRGTGKDTFEKAFELFKVLEARDFKCLGYRVHKNDPKNAFRLLIHSI